MKSPKWAEFFRGLLAELPILAGVAPFGMIYGVLAVNAGLSPAQAQGMSSIVFAGSAQIVLTQLVQSGAPGLVMVATAAVINLRHALYSASMAPYLQQLRPIWKLALSYLLTDEAYAVSAIHFQRLDERSVGLEDDHPAVPPGVFRHWFLLGAGLALWACWQISTAVGILLGAVVPVSWSLDFTLALTFIALVLPALRDRAAWAAALSAGAAALLAFGAPYKLGLLIAALVGILCGLLVEGKS